MVAYIKGPKHVVVYYISLLFFPPHDLVDFVVLPPGHGRNVTDL